MSILQEIESAVPKLTPQEVAELRAWLEVFCEDKLKLTDAVKTKLVEARRDIEAGRYQTRQTA